MYHVIKVHVGPKDKLYTYCADVTHAANNLRNATLFRVRQVLTMVDKTYETMTDNEREVYTKDNVTYMPIYFIMCIERAEIPEGDCIF